MCRVRLRLLVLALAASLGPATLAGKKRPPVGSIEERDPLAIVVLGADTIAYRSGGRHEVQTSALPRAGDEPHVHSLASWDFRQEAAQKIHDTLNSPIQVFGIGGNRRWKRMLGTYGFMIRNRPVRIVPATDLGPFVEPGDLAGVGELAFAPAGRRGDRVPDVRPLRELGAVRSLVLSFQLEGRLGRDGVDRVGLRTEGWLFPSGANGKPEKFSLTIKVPCDKGTALSGLEANDLELLKRYARQALDQLRAGLPGLVFAMAKRLEQRK